MYLKKEKGLSVETLRGLAIILVVMGHVIGNTPNAGLLVGDDTYYRIAYNFFIPLRLCLFTVISGYVYALFPVMQSSNLGTFIVTIQVP